MAFSTLAVAASCLSGVQVGRSDDGAAPPPLARSAGAAAAGSRPLLGKPVVAETPVSHIEGGQVNGRWREGSRLSGQMGYFKLAGDRVTFVSPDGKLKFDCLENLALERIARTIGDSPDQLEWSVSGLITECRGTNHLLVSVAVLKAKSARARRAP